MYYIHNWYNLGYSWQIVYITDVSDFFMAVTQIVSIILKGKNDHSKKRIVQLNLYFHRSITYTLLCSADPDIWEKLTIRDMVEDLMWLKHKLQRKTHLQKCPIHWIHKAFYIIYHTYKSIWVTNKSFSKFSHIQAHSAGINLSLGWEIWEYFNFKNEIGIG